MNVDSARTVEVQSSESPRERSGVKSTGFPALMESVLGRPSEMAKAARPEADEPADGRSRARAQRTDSGAVRKQGPRDGEPEIVPDEQSVASPAPGARPETESDDEQDASREDASETVGVVPPMDAPVWQIAAALAVPELVAMASGTAVSPDGQTDGEDSIDAVAEPALAAPGSEVVASAPVPVADNGLGDAVVGRAPIVEAEAREAAVAVVEAATSKRADESEPVAAVATEQRHSETVQPVKAAEPAEQAVRVVAEVAVVRTEPREPRTPVANRDGRPSGLDAPQLRANNEVLSPNPNGSADLGSDGSPRNGQTPPQVRTNAPVERAGGEAAAMGGVSAEAPTTGIGEASLRGGEASAQVGADAMVPSAPTSATAAATATSTPALPQASPQTSPQTERAQPGPAADAITIQTDWLATRGGGSARLVLSPPELGEIVIRVSVRQQSVEVVMIAQTALAHSMAQDQSDRLAQAFAHRDLRLDQFEVRRADPSDSSSTGQFGSSDTGARERDRAEDQSGVQGDVAGRGSRRRLGVADGGAVSPPRFVSTERASGIDLRI